jgi:hypothetical protein
MKVYFSEEDIEPGMWLIRNANVKSKDACYLSTLVLKVGFLHSGDQPHCLISALTDGMVLTYKTKKELVGVLNKSGYLRLSVKKLLWIITEREIALISGRRA